MRRAIWIAVALCGLAACTFDGSALEQRSCSSDSECGAGRCVDGFCIDPSSADGGFVEDVVEDAPDAAIGDLPVGSECGDPADCRTGVCADLEGVGVCASPCRDDEDCGDDQVCVEAETLDGCVPASGCWDVDGDGFGVGGACEGADCDDGDEEIHPDADERCDAVDRDCDGDTSNVDPLRCFGDRADLIDVGICRAGSRVCVDGTWGECFGEVLPEEEVCDNVDQDCDGQLDEGLVMDCYDGPASTRGVGLCADGEVHCTGGAWSACIGPIFPGFDLCDGEDNDCDGEVDEEYAIGEPCFSGVGECAVAGVRACASVSRAECDAIPGAPEDERCDARDNDCDGMADEDFVELGEPCEVGVGACVRSGHFVCAEDQLGVVCDVAPGAPTEELCDGIDNDCDGVVDQGLEGTREPCTAGEGACEQEGLTICAPDGMSLVCDAEARSPADEVCDGIDNDCDLELDEGFDTLGDPCTSGVGLCAREGVLVCSADGMGTTCGAIPGAPVDELCDGLDNDCDGMADEEVDTNPVPLVTFDMSGALEAQWQMNGTARHDTGYVRLTENEDNQAGSVVFREPVWTGNFEVTFEYRATAGGGWESPGDGFTFFWTDTPGPGLLGAGGLHLGYTGVGGYAIEFDTHENSADPNDNHVALDVGSTSSNLGVVEIDPGIRTGEWRRVTITRAPDLLTVRMGSSVVATFDARSVPGFVGWIGFSAGTGASNDEHDVRDMTMTCP